MGVGSALISIRNTMQKGCVLYYIHGVSVTYIILVLNYFMDYCLQHCGSQMRMHDLNVFRKASA